MPRYFFKNEFLRQQQLHAQQAAYYIWRKTNSLSSRSTVPMLSSLLMLFLKISSVLTNSKDDEIGEPSNLLMMNLWNLQLTADESHQILKHTQINNSYYHDSSQSHINFFDFVQFYCIEKQKPLHHTKWKPLIGKILHSAPLNENINSVKPMRFKYWSWAWLSISFTTCCRIISSSSSNFFQVLFISLC